VLRQVITDYTREAGVRQLERELGTLLRKTATQIASAAAPTPIAIDPAAVRDALGRARFFHEAAIRTAVPGVATGLAVTGTGGDVLFIEATGMPGSGKLTITGQLGEVMKESAQAALSYVRGHYREIAPKLDDEWFAEHDVHVHVPAGAIPKDGPSAGITMATALASLLSERPVKHTVGMTGEVTLQGRVLPIGGLKQKVLAAHAAGLTEVIIPERNRADLDDVPADVREAMTFHPVMTLGEVLSLALEPKSKPQLHAVYAVQAAARGGRPRGRPPRAALDARDPLGLRRGGGRPLQRVQAGARGHPAAHARAAPRRARGRRRARAARP
jgi:ATP-dependent Lon protease